MTSGDATRYNGAVPHVLQVFQPEIGGVPTYVTSLAAGLADRSWQMTLACPPDSVGLDEALAAGARLVPIEVSRAPHPKLDRRAIGLLRVVARRHRVDLLHGHSTKANLLTAVVARTVGIPSIYTPHGWSFQMLHVSRSARVAFAGFEMAAVRGAQSLVLDVSHAEATAASRLGVVPRRRVRVVHTGIADIPSSADARPAARAALGLDRRGAVFAWIGRVGPQKRPELLEPIAQRVRGAAMLVALGSGLDDAGKLTAALCDAGVRLLPPGTPAAALLAAADGLLMTSAWEAFPLVVLEAMRAGLPVVAPCVGGVPEQVEDGVTGFVVAPGDTDALADRLLCLATDKARRERMAAAARRRFMDAFQRDRMLSGVEAVYREVLSVMPR